MENIYSTASINRVVSYARAPSSFLLDKFFPMLQTEPDSEEIHFDIDKSKPRLAPLVHPTRAGKVVENEGFETQSFKPAYVKDKRRLSNTDPLRRMAGEQIGGTMTPMERRAQALATSIRNQLDGLGRRETLMAAEALRTGKVTVSGEGYPTRVVDFKREATLTKALTLAARWGEAGVRPIRNLETWAGEITTHGGVSASDIVMDPLAAQLLRDDPDYEKMLNRDATRWKENLRDGPVTVGVGSAASTWLGKLGQIDLCMYQESYVDDDGNSQNMLPDYSVIMGASGPMGNGVGGLEGTRCYGAILDEEAEFRAERYFGKSWLEKDPSVRWLLMQSAPLVVPYRPNGSLYSKVR
jgi:hypothetical protein